mmetsp:Transcript_32/g.116  ORF Transcript_32/g.116 Transcript_32/m.116 type:complete len:216 (-) Transcript_32:205-852(-)
MVDLEPLERLEGDATVISGADGNLGATVVLQERKEVVEVSEGPGVSLRVRHVPGITNGGHSMVTVRSEVGVHKVNADALNIAHRRAAQGASVVHHTSGRVVAKSLFEQNHGVLVHVALRLKAHTELLSPLAPHVLEVNESSILVEDHKLGYKAIIERRDWRGRGSCRTACGEAAVAHRAGRDAASGVVHNRCSSCCAHGCGRLHSRSCDGTQHSA